MHLRKSLYSCLYAYPCKLLLHECIAVNFSIYVDIFYT